MDRRRENQTDGHTERNFVQTYRQKWRESDSCTERETDRDIQTDRRRESDKQTDRQTESDR